MAREEWQKFFNGVDLTGWAATENSKRAHYLEIVKDKVLVISGLGQTIYFQKQNINQTINTLAMASPFSLEEKQILLETTDIKNRKVEFERILQTYVVDNFNNTTIQ